MAVIKCFSSTLTLSTYGLSQTLPATWIAQMFLVCQCFVVRISPLLSNNPVKKMVSLVLHMCFFTYSNS